MNDRDLESAAEHRTLVLTGNNILSLIVVLGMANAAFQFTAQEKPEIADECVEGRMHAGDVLQAVMRQHPDLVEELYGFKPTFIEE